MSASMRIFGWVPAEDAVTFGDLFYMGTSEIMERDVHGNTTGNVSRREYSLDSGEQRMVVVVRIPAEVPARKFKPDEMVELVNVRLLGQVAGDYRDRSPMCLIEADDIRAAKPGQGSPPPQQSGQGGNTKS